MRNIRNIGVGLLLFLSAVASAMARTSNGNDLALYLCEARNNDERQAVVEEGQGRPHYFRYLQIMDMEEGKTNGYPFVWIRAFEPSSYMDVEFTVTKRVSRGILAEDPKSVIGDAIAVTGRFVGVDWKRNTIRLHPVIVRHKDRLSPKLGKELLCEIDPGATFYSFTGGKKEVNLTYKDRDLLRFENSIIRKSGKQAWADFLRKELAKREKERAQKRAEQK